MHFSIISLIICGLFDNLFCISFAIHLLVFVYDGIFMQFRLGALGLKVFIYLCVAFVFH